MTAAAPLYVGAKIRLSAIGLARIRRRIQMHGGGAMQPNHRGFHAPSRGVVIYLNGAEVVVRRTGCKGLQRQPVQFWELDN